MRELCLTEQSPWGVTACSLVDISPALGGSTKERAGRQREVSSSPDRDAWSTHLAHSVVCIMGSQKFINWAGLSEFIADISDIQSTAEQEWALALFVVSGRGRNSLWFCCPSAMVLKAKPVRYSKSQVQFNRKKEKNKIHGIVQKKTTDRVRIQPDTLLVVLLKWSCWSSNPVEKSVSSWCSKSQFLSR